jgi:hypothetical protein
MDTFDLKKFLKESKALENLNPAVKAINEGEAIEKKKMTKEAMKKQIKDMIVAELEGEDLEDATKRAEKGDSTDLALHMAGVKEETATDMMDPVYEGDDEDYELEDRKVKYGIDPEKDDEDYSNYFFDIDTPEEDLEEAKKKKDEEVEDTETIDATIEDLPVEDEAPAEDTPEATGGLEDIAADMKGTEADLMDHLMKAFQIAKGMGNEKLETQVGNTLKFFVSEYIGGGEG